MEKIKTEYPKDAGIYKLTCINNGKIYIGKGNNIETRLSNHRRCANRSNGKCYFENALIKYGWDSFEVEILELIPNFDKNNPTHKELIHDKESYYIELFNSTDINVGYNLCKRSNDRTGILCSEETKKKMSLAALGKPKSKEHIEKMRKTKTGVPHPGHSPEALEKMSLSKLGKKRPEFSEEWKQNIGKGHIGLVMSEEAKEKIGKAHKGKPKSKEAVEKMRHSLTGRKASEETKEKMSRSQLGRTHTEESKEKLRQINLGRKMSPEARENMRKARLAYIEKHKNE